MPEHEAEASDRISNCVIVMLYSLLKKRLKIMTGAKVSYFSWTIQEKQSGQYLQHEWSKGTCSRLLCKTRLGYATTCWPRHEGEAIMHMRSINAEGSELQTSEHRTASMPNTICKQHA